jgi:arylsulfatase
LLAYLEHTDAQIGKLVNAIEEMGLRDNTLIIYIVGDNGPSAEGSLTGTLNNMKTQLGLLDDVSTMLKKIDELGGPLHENHYPVGWAGLDHRLSMDEASRLALRRHTQRSCPVVAETRY